MPVRDEVGRRWLRGITAAGAFHVLDDCDARWARCGRQPLPDSQKRLRFFFFHGVHPSTPALRAQQAERLARRPGHEP
eukprot:50402-Alexandrium_andersonii.AAC.1